ncbi:MAG: AAA family ATPase [Muribaculaceae bacterium]|nr:AAA family ATPase [Muribaculaceae bacterium]
MTAPERNSELELAWEYVEHTGMSIFLTGKAGTGKTTFLRTLRKNSAKSMVVVAPTGVAAINAGGVTIHSFFQLPTSPYVPGSEYRDKFSFGRDKLRIIRALDLLVIDEISMVRSDLLDAIDNALRKYRRSPLPFGGVQLLMIGDLQQLAPVVTPQDEVLLRQHYSTPYFFGSNALAQIPYVTIELKRVYRQQNRRFVELLNNVRENRITPDDMALLSTRLDASFRPRAGSGFVRLTTHNYMADNYNAAELARIQAPVFSYRAVVKGTFPEYSYPTAECLDLKMGAQVMFVKNDPGSDRRYYNGKIGHVVYADKGMVKVLCPGEDEPIEVVPQAWENARYTVNELTNRIDTEVQGTFTQMPLRLAWAITIHKSQGLTFDNVIIDAGSSFAPGQVYVALSRCKTLEGIVLATPISTGALGADPMVEGYITRQEAEARRSNEILDDIRQEYFRQLLLDLFNFRNLVNMQGSLTRLLGQTFSHSFANQTEAQQGVELELKEKVVEVADKWIRMLSAMPVAELRDENLQARVGKSAIYFRDTLTAVFGDSLKQAAKVRTDNKKASQRVKDLVGDLRQQLDIHLCLLEKIAVHGFSVAGYLHFKADASLDSSRESSLKRVARGGRLEKGEKKPKERKPKAPKEPKIPSHQISYNMFAGGMTRYEIADERNLALSTVMSHLMQHVADGEIELRDVLTPMVMNAIESALENFDGDSSGDYSSLLASLPSGVSRWDVKLVADYLKHDL